jgi:hypothetical protein
MVRLFLSIAEMLVGELDVSLPQLLGLGDGLV